MGMEKRQYANRGPSTLAAIMTGIVLIWSGIDAILLSIGWGDVDISAYSVSLIVPTTAGLVVSWMAIRNGDIGRGTTTLVLNLLIISIIAEGHFGSLEAYLMLELSSIIPLLSCTPLLVRDGRRWDTTSIILLSVGLLCGSIGDDSLFLLSGILILSSGAMMFAGSMGPGPSSKDDGRVNAMPACMALIAVQSIESAMILITDMTSIVPVILGASIAVLSAKILLNGRAVIGLAMTMYSLCSVVISPSVASDPEVWRIMAASASAISVICSASCIAGGNRIFGAGMATFAFGSAISTITGSNIPLEIGLSVLALTSMISASRSDGEQEVRKNEILPEIPATHSTGLMVLAFMLITTALTEFLECDIVVSNRVLLVECIYVLGFSVIAMKGRMITETVLLILSGTMAIVFPLADSVPDANAPLPTNVFMVIGFAVCAYVYARQHSPFRSFGCIMLIATLASSLITDSNTVHASMMLLAGIVFLIVSMKKTYRFGLSKTPRMTERASTKQSDNQYPVVLIMTVTILLLLILSLISETGVIASVDDSGMDILRLVLLLMASGFGFYCMAKGITAAALFLFGSCTVGVASAVLSFAGSTLPVEYRLLMVLLFVTVTYTYFRMKDKIMFMMSLFVLLGLSVGPFLPRTDLFDIMNIAVKIVSGMVAITLWIEYDTGRVILPKVSWRWRKDLIEEGPVRDIPRCIRICGTIMCSIVLIWTGATGFLFPDGGLGPSLAVVTISVMTLIVSAWLFRTGSEMEGMFVLAVSSWCLGYGASASMGANMGFEPASTLLVAMVSLVLMIKRKWGAASVSVSVTIAMFMSAVDSVALLGNWMMVLIGAVMLVDGSEKLVLGRKCETIPIDERTGPFLMAAAAGISVLLAGNVPSTISAAVISLVVLSYSVVSASSDRIGDASALVAVSIYGLIVGPLSILDMAPPLVVMIVSALFALYAAYRFSETGDRVMMMGTALAGTLILISSVLPSEEMLGAGLTVMSIAFLIRGMLGERSGTTS